MKQLLSSIVNRVINGDEQRYDFMWSVSVLVRFVQVTMANENYTILLIGLSIICDLYLSLVFLGRWPGRLLSTAMSDFLARNLREVSLYFKINDQGRINAQAN
jgi:hypothetical protein